MSLINDALRRKDQDQKTAASPEKPDGAPMEAVLPATRSNASYLAPILITLIVLVLVMAGLLLWKGFQTQQPIVATEKAPVAPVQAAPMENPAAAPVPEVAAAQPIDPAAAVPTPATNPVVPPPPAEPPPLRLQGIFYRISHPTAMINGKTVAVGESTSGARVLKIERQHVTVIRDGKQEVLTLE